MSCALFYVQSQESLSSIDCTLEYIHSILQGLNGFLLQCVCCFCINIKRRLNIRMSHNPLYRLHIILSLAQSRAERMPHVIA